MANEKRLIFLDEALKATHSEIYWTESEQAAVRSFLVKQPKVDAVEVVHGRWTAVAYTKHCNCDKASNSFKEYLYKCSACNRVAYKQPYGLNYCPNCGAKMDGGNEDA